MNPQDPHKVMGGAPAPSIHATAAKDGAAERFIGWVRLWLPWAYHLQATFTNNRSTLISYRREKNLIVLRLHNVFAQAGPEVAQAVGDYLTGNKRHAQVLKQFIASIETQVVSLSRPAQQGSLPCHALRTVGLVHQLVPIFNSLNTTQFADRCTATIGWGRAVSRPGRKRSVVLGSYACAQNLIRVHPCLDQPFVPEYVVRGVVHHEMLHEIMGVQKVRGRRRVHPPEFIAIEQMYPDYARCSAWEQANIGRLLAYRP